MFKNARISLTAFYLIAIMSVSLLFSAIIYRVVTLELSTLERNQRSRIERRFQDRTIFLNDDQTISLFPLPPNTELIQDTSKRVLFRLTIINIGIFIASTVIGYMLAGRTLKPIADMVDEQNRFITDASHELRTPLTSLKSGFEVFLRSKKNHPKETKTLIEESLAEVGKLQKLSDSLLELARFEIKNSTVFQKLDLQKVLKDSVKHVKTIADKKGIHFNLKSSSLKISGNYDQLVDMFIIILDNAIKYSPYKSQVLITSVKRGNKANVIIKDQGIGIVKKDLPRIFDRFYRSDSSRNKISASGYGLGLSIAKKIADAHYIAFKVKSEPGKGTEFEVHLPITK